MHESTIQIPSPFIHSHNIWKNIVHGAWCPHPHANYPNANKGGWGPSVGLHGLTN
jgi:hypothetical protein